jgi:hypothetical protein
VEVDAYHAQIAAGAVRERCAINLSTMYRLDLTYQQAMELLA